MVSASSALPCKSVVQLDLKCWCLLSPDESGMGLSTMEANVKRTKKPKGGAKDITVRACAPTSCTAHLL